MYNLIVINTDWSSGRASLPFSRMCEYTGSAIIDRFGTGSGTDVAALRAFPCLFLREGDSFEEARIGVLTDVTPKKSEVHFSYEFDPFAPPLTNQFLLRLRLNLNIEEFEFFRNHWAVKNVDLYKFVISKVKFRRQLPRVFALAEQERIDQELVSVMMPFRKEFDTVFEAIADACAGSAMTCARADNFWEQASVIQDIVTLIDRSRLVICDCTSRNPNVFYEIGIAHTLGREVILITQADDDIPFDLRHLRYIKYLSNKQGLQDLTKNLQSRISTIIKN